MWQLLSCDSEAENDTGKIVHLGCQYYSLPMVSYRCLPLWVCCSQLPLWEGWHPPISWRASRCHRFRTFSFDGLKQAGSWEVLICDGKLVGVTGSGPLASYLKTRCI